MRARGQATAWYVISLRPRGGHAAVRRAATRRGAGVLALSPWALRPRADAATREALARALDAPRVVFTSPAAVRAADALQPLGRAGRRDWFAVGAGTAAALRRAGVDGVASPARMDSEGALALAGLVDVDDTEVGLVTAPGGRGLLATTLEARGARVRRADVYVREPLPPAPRAVAALEALRAPAVVLLSSEAALSHALGRLPAAARGVLLGCPVVAASDRLHAFARSTGFAVVARAAGPRPAQLVEAAAAVAGRLAAGPFR